MNGLRFAGWGTALPEGVITTAEIADRFGIEESWILDRTGMAERRTGSTTNELAAQAARAALADAALEPADLAAVIVATCSPSQGIPSTAAFVQRELGIPSSAFAFDLNSACSGFVYGLVVAEGLIGVGSGPILLVGAETMTSITDYDDRDTAILFGDGAGAAVLVPDVPGSLLAFDLGNDATGFEALTCDPGGVMVMDGRTVFDYAVSSITETVPRCLAKARVDLDEVRLFVPHQANQRIIASAWRQLGIPMDRTALTLQRTGNTSAASIPIALAHAISCGQARPDDLVLLVGFGAGMSWGTALVRL